MESDTIRQRSFRALRAQCTVLLRPVSPVRVRLVSDAMGIIVDSMTCTLISLDSLRFRFAQWSMFKM